jgi:hypothetical protein
LRYLKSRIFLGKRDLAFSIDLPNEARFATLLAAI